MFASCGAHTFESNGLVLLMHIVQTCADYTQQIFEWCVFVHVAYRRRPSDGNDGNGREHTHIEYQQLE